MDVAMLAPWTGTRAGPPPGDLADSYTARCHPKHPNQLPLATAILLLQA
jgi:hypothetical protein